MVTGARPHSRYSQPQHETEQRDSGSSSLSYYLDVGVQDAVWTVRLLGEGQHGGGEQENPAFEARSHAALPSASTPFVRGTHAAVCEMGF